MPPKSRIVIFGALADEPFQIDSKNFFFRDKKLEGFWLSRRIKGKGFFAKLLLAGRVQKLLGTELQTHVQARFPLEDIIPAIERYTERRTEGKIPPGPPERELVSVVPTVLHNKGGSKTKMACKISHHRR